MKKIKVLGTGLNSFDSYPSAYRELKKLIDLNYKNYITVNNVHTVTCAALNKNYRSVLNNSVLSLPDGKPLSVVAKIKGEKNIARIFGPSFMEYCLDKGRKDNLKHYFFGSTEKILNIMISNAKFKYPGVNIAGYYSPPFKLFTDNDNEQFGRMLNESDSDLIWIGLGAPKQELWMAKNFKKLNRGIFIGIGAGFDYLAGNLKHAPLWMKNSSLEWLYRLIQDPKRLWKRYLLTNSLFILFVILELTKLKKFE